MFILYFTMLYMFYIFCFIYGFNTAHDLASNINGVDTCYNWRVVLVLQEQNNKFYSVLQYIKVFHPRDL
jgi:hypothetical protein